MIDFQHFRNSSASTFWYYPINLYVIHFNGIYHLFPIVSVWRIIAIILPSSSQLHEWNLSQKSRVRNCQTCVKAQKWKRPVNITGEGDPIPVRLEVLSFIKQSSLMLYRVNIIDKRVNNGARCCTLMPGISLKDHGRAWSIWAYWMKISREM